MSAASVGKFGERHNEHGEDVPCQVIQYAAGRDAGDHLVFGGTTAKEHAAGSGDVFRDWLQVGDKNGQVSVAG